MTPITKVYAIIRLTEGREWIDTATITQAGIRDCFRKALDVEQACGPGWAKANPRLRMAKVDMVALPEAVDSSDKPPASPTPAKAGLNATLSLTPKEFFLLLTTLHDAAVDAEDDGRDGCPESKVLYKALGQLRQQVEDDVKGEQDAWRRRHGGQKP